MTEHKLPKIVTDLKNKGWEDHLKRDLEMEGTSWEDVIETDGGCYLRLTFPISSSSEASVLNFFSSNIYAY